MAWTCIGCDLDWPLVEYKDYKQGLETNAVPYRACEKYGNQGKVHLANKQDLGILAPGQETLDAIVALNELEGANASRALAVAIRAGPGKEEDG